MLTANLREKNIVVVQLIILNHSISAYNPLLAKYSEVKIF